MSLPLGPVIALYNTLTTPIPFLVSLGLPVSTLDVVGSLRLALVVQQIKLAFKMRAVQQAASEGEDKNGEKVAPSFPTDTALSNIWTMLVIVYGGELFVSSFVSQPPSFFTSTTGPTLLTLGHYVISAIMTYAPGLLPQEPSLKWELPLSIFDALTRSMLLCSIGPPTILGHKSVTISDSPAALLLTSTIMANGGFFIVNVFNMLSPTGWSIQTPPELQPGGWASLDLLSAPFITSLFATLTQSQSTWRSAAATAGNYVSAFNLTTPEGSMPGEKPTPGNGGLDDDTARAICTVLLMTMFSGRAVKNFGGLPALRRLFGIGEFKIKTQ
ncbi:hypothetical protein M407DRAFT_247073 [Tulasnella calospora MUT 4182]|uniref:Uncharacterized protein n=1 Tax=Tulasnella calospora MUT 4182 TaxID=1051891 RepID=A0A0C3PNT8_9AGAM|nr:hypothetical protein M407DRAFT_247073 [Tulasnella calospora MUT 4182]